jgi:hypothetical protein
VERGEKVCNGQARAATRLPEQEKMQTLKVAEYFLTPLAVLRDPITHSQLPYPTQTAPLIQNLSPPQFTSTQFRAVRQHISKCNSRTVDKNLRSTDWYYQCTDRTQ